MLSRLRTGRNRGLVTAILLSCWLGGAGGATAADVTTTQLAPGIAMLSGRGGNIGVCYGEDGVVLVDEIENGIHHTALRNLWEKIGQFAHHLGVQFFASTHSRECIEAAHEVFSKSQKRCFVLHRLYRKAGSVQSETYEGEKLKGALELDLEVR